MSEDVILTIAFPTFNRSNSIAKRLTDLFAKQLPSEVSVLVLDNDSSDDTWMRLWDFQGDHPQLTVERNRQNIGFAGSFFELFRRSSSEFLMVVSDEDTVAHAELQEYCKFLARCDASVVSPVADNFGNYRGRKRAGLIRPEDFREASNYISGCTFSVARAMEVLPKIEAVVSSNEMAALYPQVLLTGELLIESHGVWYPRVLTSKSEELETVIRDLGGSRYTGLSSRSQQAVDLFEFFSYARNDPAKDLRGRQVRAAVGKNFVHILRNSLRLEDEELFRSFEFEAKTVYGYRRRLNLLLNRVSSGLRNPHLVWRRFGRYWSGL